MTKALVIGAGALGIALTHTLHNAGYSVVLASRSGQNKTQRPLPTRANITHLKMDFLKPLSAAPVINEGFDVMYFCATPKFWRWSEELHLIVKNALALAKSLNIPFIYADNLYAYGPSTDVINEWTPHIPLSRKGTARLLALELVLNAHRGGTAKTAVIQAADFYGPGVKLSMVGESIIKSASRGRVTCCLGNVGKQHSFTFIDDFAYALFAVSCNLACFGQVWIAPCTTSSVRQFIETVATLSGRTAEIWAIPKLIFLYLGWRNRSIRELREIYYFYTEDFIVDSQKIKQTLGLAATPLEQGIRLTLAADALH